MFDWFENRLSRNDLEAEVIQRYTDAGLEVPAITKRMNRCTFARMLEDLAESVPQRRRASSRKFGARPAKQ